MTKNVRKQLLLAIAFVLVFQTTLTSATTVATASTARRDQAAVQAVNQALTAMGGAVAWSQVSSAVVTGTCTAPAEQGGASASFRWTSQGQEFRYETDTVNGGPVYLSGHGSPSVAASNGNVTLSPEYRLLNFPYHFPGTPLQTAVNDKTYSIQFIGQESLNGNLSLHIRVVRLLANAKILGTQQDWWFDPTSNLPVQVSYMLPSQSNSQYAHLIWEFGGWSQEGNLILPHQLSQSFGGEFSLQSCSVLGVQTNTNPAATFFDAR